MGITFVTMEVSNPARTKSRKCKFLVDSGAIFSVVPAKVLVAIGIEPDSEEEFRLADGKDVKWGVGNAFFVYRGKVRAAPVIFGEKDVFLLGATTLEALGLMLDPVRREIRPLPMLVQNIRSAARPRSR